MAPKLTLTLQICTIYFTPVIPIKVPIPSEIDDFDVLKTRGLVTLNTAANKKLKKSRLER